MVQPPAYITVLVAPEADQPRLHGRQNHVSTRPPVIATMSRLLLLGRAAQDKRLNESRPYADPSSIAGRDPSVDIGFPGAFPFTRGIQPTMYRGRLWTMRQYAGFGSAAESNQRYRYLLSQGVSGLSVAFDLPTQIGYDSDHELAAGEVGRVGVAIDSIEDMSALFEGIPLGRVSTSMTINATAIVLLALYIAVARRQGVAPAALAGTIQNDILKEYVARGTYIYPPRASLRIVTDIFAFCERELPNWNTISISGYHIREAGSTAVQEVAFTFANAIAYVHAAIDAGLDVNAFGQRLSFFFNAHNDFLEEVAKFRAARRLWARIMRDRFGATNPRAQHLRFHTQTAGSTLTAQQPDNNIVRVALQALAAVMGGTQSLHCNGRDEALALPTEASARLALRTQQVIAAESGVANTSDPFGGAYAVEELTNRIEDEARALLDRIDASGGTLAAIEAGIIQREIQESAYRAQQEIDAGGRVVVGVNRFASGEASEIDMLQMDPDIERRQIERVQRVRAAREAGEWRAALDAVAAAARDGSNLVPPIIAAVEARATIGEISDTLRSVFGEHKEIDA
jgi:methylmalonyl-CoA mutase N-terminal domain/subunit